MQANRTPPPSLVIAMIIDMNEANMQSSAALKTIELEAIEKQVSKAFEKIAPFWPLKNLIAVNPLRGFENLPFEEAIAEGMNYFQQDSIPTELMEINKETIKWCQAFFDEGQSVINMPFRDQGLYQCFKQLIIFDKKSTFISTLPSDPGQAILICLDKLGIVVEQYTEFLTLLLTTLPGWASYVCYKTNWSQANGHLYPITQIDYLAMRTILTYLIWPKGIDLFYWHQKAKSIFDKKYINTILIDILENEKKYRDLLLNLLNKKNNVNTKINETPRVQWVFCIDVRSEPFRHTIEIQTDHETFGFAGFFGIPAKIKNELDESDYTSCPVLLSPKHTVNENISCPDRLKNKILQKKQRIKTIKHVYQMLKYMFTTPFVLVDALGLWSGLWMLISTIAPITASKLNERFLIFSKDKVPVTPILEDINHIDGINFREQSLYAENFLRMIGLTKKFASLIIICGHGAKTKNNAYHSALDCGACGGRNGAPNARILAAILNDHKIRTYLREKNIFIPEKSIFIPALHHTTTDEIEFYGYHKNSSIAESIDQLQFDLLSARKKINNNYKHRKQIQKRSSDWAQTRPEWGLAKNAAFIVGPRHLTKNVNLDGRAFLHSYDWEVDKDATLLTNILTAPMIVAQWINYQYLFSTLDNVAYGSGSKITQNVTGKIGIMQGNGSDLMHGLPLQSVNQHDQKRYHEPLRLLTVVYAPRSRIDNIISQKEILKNLFRHSWVSLICIDPENNFIYSLRRDLTWQA